LTCPKVGTWDRLVYFPSEGRHAEDIFTSEKNPTASVGIEQANSGTRGQHANHQTTEAVLFNLYSECLTKEALEGLGDFNIGGQIIQNVLVVKEETVLQGMNDKLI
jgi:hypothetical protein